MVLCFGESFDVCAYLHDRRKRITRQTDFIDLATLLEPRERMLATGTP